MKKKIVIIVDTTIDFMMKHGKLPVGGADNIIVAGIEFLVGLDPDEIECVIFTTDVHDEEIYMKSEEAKMFQFHCGRGTVGVQNVFNFNLIDKRIPVYTLEKHVFDMWEEEPMEVIRVHGDEWRTRDEFFLELRKEVDTAICWGVAADYCLKFAVKGAVDRGFNVEIPEHLTRGIAREISQVVAEDFAGQAVELV